MHSASACCKDGVGRGGDSKNVYTQAAPGAALAAKRVDVTFGQGVVTGAEFLNKAARTTATSAAQSITTTKA